MGSPSIKKFKIPAPLSAQDKQGFAYKTLRDRLPEIVLKTIDFLHRERKQLHKFGGTIENPTDEQLLEIELDVERVIGKLAQLCKDLETNNELQPFKKHDLEPELQYLNDDVDRWNKILENHRLDDNSLPRWYDSPWLLVECYMYRKMLEALLDTKHLKTFDYFVDQKQMACKCSLPQMLIVSNHLKELDLAIKSSPNGVHPQEKVEFNMLMQLALWANKCDLSFSGMNPGKMSSQSIANNIHEHLENLQDNILCNSSSGVWSKIQSIKNEIKKKYKDGDNSMEPVYIDLVADNAGYEIFVDLCLFYFLTLCFKDIHNSPLKFRLHLKRVPWFVSDTQPKDVYWLMDFMTATEQPDILRELGNKWKSLFASNCWQILVHKFWNMPNDYSEMSLLAPDLYGIFSESSLIIFKGDLNYRKLIGDRKWHILTPLRVALREFAPAPVVAIRTIKAQVAVGIEDVNTFARINNNELPKDWMTTGDFGLIQFMDPL